MDGCYHDTQDFKSDLNIEVAREGDILEAGQDLDEIECDKNPGHRGFIPFKDLTLEHIPNENRSKEMLDRIKKMGSQVVRLVVDNNKIGTGIVLKRKQNIFVIQTNNHVVKTDDEVKQCTVEFHYDDDSGSGVFRSRGVELLDTCPYRDFTFFTIHPVPEFLYQLDLVYDKIPEIIIGKNDEIQHVEVLVRKRPNTAQNVYLSSLNLNSSHILSFILCHDGSYSYLKSSYFKFKPIPSNIQQQLTPIEIRIAMDDGNSRVIPGDVVTFGDEFVVRISESIFQDEVKKCRLVWNGEVIGRGTRLYFEQIKASEVYRKIDLYKGQERSNFWIFEFHPITRELEDMFIHSVHTKNLCCIGHPHGGIKMVTFGRFLGESIERFDKQYRRIAQPKPDCKCTEVGCINYSCKTCKGSSGSAVIELYKGIDWGYSICHFMGERKEELLPSGELIENINIAWTV